MTTFEVLLEPTLLYAEGRGTIVKPLKINVPNQNREFIEEIDRKSRSHVEECYQCGKCSAGCPLAFEMDILPSRTMRYIQLGMREKVLKSHTIWLCASCETCSTRCPKEVDIAGVMDALRIIARQEGYVEQEPEISTFYKVFLSNMRRFGRIYELGLVAQYNLGSRHLFQDAEKGLPLFLKGRIHLIPKQVQGANKVKEIMNSMEKLNQE